MDLLADVLFWTVVLVAGGAIVAFLVLAAVTGPKAKRHPEGWRGSLRDEFLITSAIAPWLVMVVAGWMVPSFRETSWWLPIFVTLAVAGFAASFLLPPVRRARARLSALQRSPAQ